MATEKIRSIIRFRYRDRMTEGQGLVQVKDRVHIWGAGGDRIHFRVSVMVSL